MPETEQPKLSVAELEAQRAQINRQLAEASLQETGVVKAYLDGFITQERLAALNEFRSRLPAGLARDKLDDLINVCTLVPELIQSEIMKLQLQTGSSPA